MARIAALLACLIAPSGALAQDCEPSALDLDPTLQPLLVSVSAMGRIGLSWEWLPAARGHRLHRGDLRRLVTEGYTHSIVTEPPAPLTDRPMPVEDSYWLVSATCELTGQVFDSLGRDSMGRERPDGSIDDDGDGIPNWQDRCPELSSADNRDLDGDGLGDACDPCVLDPTNIDSDGDGRCDDGDGSGVVGDVPCSNWAVPFGRCDDNCPGEPNPAQRDADLDGVGDRCDPDDSDEDGVPDGTDTCPGAWDPDQTDEDGDGHGDACDNCHDLPNEQVDSDRDFLGDACDNCRDDPNVGQEDQDGDGHGDACDSCPGVDDFSEDEDGDGVPAACDFCPESWDAEQADIDGDGFGESCDTCPGTYDPQQGDADGDGDGDACDSSDSDGDGWIDAADGCPSIPDPTQADADADRVGDDCDNCPDVDNRWQEDSDGDGVGDACQDSDGDGIADATDVCPLTPDPLQLESDGDGWGDACDVCPMLPDAAQVDSDADGLGDACETDDADGDGIADPDDLCPDVANPAQLDPDDDGVGSACDLCPDVADPTQSDLDGDGLGDECDLAEALLTIALVGMGEVTGTDLIVRHPAPWSRIESSDVVGIGPLADGAPGSPFTLANGLTPGVVSIVSLLVVPESSFPIPAPVYELLVRYTGELPTLEDFDFIQCQLARPTGDTHLPAACELVSLEPL